MPGVEALAIGTLLVVAALATVAVVMLLVNQKSLKAQLSSAASAQAVAESKIENLTGLTRGLDQKNVSLSDERLVLSGDRERLSALLAEASNQLQRETKGVTDLRLLLEQKERLLVGSEANARVLASEKSSLTARVSQLEGELTVATGHARTQSDELAKLKALAAALNQQRQSLEARLVEQKTWIEEQTRFFEQKIANVATQLLDEKSRAFTEINKKEIDAVVAPFKTQLNEFRLRVDAIYEADIRDRSRLGEQVAQLARLNQTVSQKADELTRALTISSKATGDWGEVILDRILEDSGLREGHEYRRQHTVTAADEIAFQRPDAVILLPEDRQIVVDAKVSNKAWTEYCSATDEEARQEKLAEHMTSLRSHMRNLAARDYISSPDLQTVDFTLMFVPVEAALLTAFSRDPSLYSDAYRSKVVLVVPSTLMAVLKLVEGMWAFQKRKESADQIAEAGRKLYEKLTVFAGTFVEIGAAIGRTQAAFDRAQGQLTSGKGNALRLAQKMVELGVRPAAGKEMPPDLMDVATDEDPDNDEDLLAERPPVIEGNES